MLAAVSLRLIPRITSHRSNKLTNKLSESVPDSPEKSTIHRHAISSVITVFSIQYQPTHRTHFDAHFGGGQA